MDDKRLQRVWLMDWFGQLITQPAENAGLIREGFIPGDYPDTFLVSSWPMKLPTKMSFRHTASLAQGLPDAEIIEAGESLVALEDQDSGNFFSINPRTQDTHWNAGSLNDWERFIPLTKEMLDGLSILQDHSFGEVKMGGHPAPTLRWPSVAENVGNFAWLGGFSFSITRNLSKLKEIGSTPAGKSVEVVLASPHGDVARVTVVRSEKEL